MKHRSIKESLTSMGQALINMWENPWFAAILAALIYLGIAAYQNRLFSASVYNYYSYLADALLHRSFALQKVPPANLDLSVFQGHYYLNWGPLPALLMLPFVAIFGVGFNDVIFTGLFAAFCVGMCAWLLQRVVKADLIHVSKPQRGLLVFFLTLGTVLVTLASKGRVWQTAQIVAFAFTFLAYLAALNLTGKKAWFFTGLALACAAMSRATTLFVGIFPLVYLIYKEKPWDWKRLCGSLFIGGAPILAGVALLLYYNYARFGNILETGLSYHLMSPYLQTNFNMYGVSNVHYFLTNLYYEYIYYPFPLKEETKMGGSLFLLSPLFIAIFPAIFKGKPRWVVWALLASILITNIPIMFFMNTGFVTFGPRYTLDFTVPLLLLTAIGMEKWKNWVIAGLIIVSILQYLVGVYSFSQLL